MQKFASSLVSLPLSKQQRTLKRMENFLICGLLLVFLLCGLLILLRPAIFERNGQDLQCLEQWVHAGLFLLDALLLGLMLSLKARHRELRCLLVISCLWGGFSSLICITAWTLFPGRLFTLMRLTGLALFIHLPILLLGLAWLGRHWGRGFLVLGALGLSSTGFFAYHIEPEHLEVRHFSWSHPSLQGLERPVKLALIADIQTEQVGQFQREIFSRLAQQEPDLVIHTGDYLQTWSVEEYGAEIQKLRRLMSDSHLNPPFGTFATIGDTDVPGVWETLFDNGLGQVLVNRTRVLQLPGVQVNLTGLGVARSRAQRLSNLREAQQGSEQNAVDIVFGHSPDFADLLANQPRPFLALAGHTHGGQVRLPGFGPLLTYSRLPKVLAEGFHSLGPGKLAVSRGLGLERMDAPRLRFLCRPEILMITLLPPS